MNYRTYTYYTLRDMIKYFEEDDFNESSYQLGVFQRGEFINLIQFMYDPIDPYDNGTWAKDETNILWCQYFAPGHLDSYIIRSSNENDVKTKYIDWMTDWVYIVNLTYNKYKKLIDLYKQEENNLLNQLENTNITKFNDTPQNSGDYTSDDYSTNITTSTNKSDNSTVINRLSEIRALYDDIYTAWSDEFKHFFITTARYEYDQ